MAWDGGGKRNRRREEWDGRCNAGARCGEMAGVERGGVPDWDQVPGRWRGEGGGWMPFNVMPRTEEGDGGLAERVDERAVR